jgi:hypothetical protein
MLRSTVRAVKHATASVASVPLARTVGNIVATIHRNPTIIPSLSAASANITSSIAANRYQSTVASKPALAAATLQVSITHSLPLLGDRGIFVCTIFFSCPLHSHSHAPHHTIGSFPLHVLCYGTLITE